MQRKIIYLSSLNMVILLYEKSVSFRLLPRRRLPKRFYRLRRKLLFSIVDGERNYFLRIMNWLMILSLRLLDYWDERKNLAYIRFMSKNMDIYIHLEQRYSAWLKGEEIRETRISDLFRAPAWMLRQVKMALRMFM